MTIAEMLGQSGVLTLLGMGIVFGFLIIMIICLTLTGKLIHALGADKDLNTPVQTGSSSAVKTTAVTAAITAAVSEYRASH